MGSNRPTDRQQADAYSVKPIDQHVLIEACRATGSRLVVAEDHHPEGAFHDADG